MIVTVEPVVVAQEKPEHDADVMAFDDTEMEAVAALPVFGPVPVAVRAPEQLDPGATAVNDPVPPDAVNDPPVPVPEHVPPQV